MREEQVHPVTSQRAVCYPELAEDVEADLRSVLLYPSTSEGQVEEGVMVLKAETDVDSLSVVTDISEIWTQKHSLLKELEHDGGSTD